MSAGSRLGGFVMNIVSDQNQFEGALCMETVVSAYKEVEIEFGIPGARGRARR